MIISFKTLELVHYDQIILILELIFQCEDCYFILAKKTAESYKSFAGQISLTSSAEFVEPS